VDDLREPAGLDRLLGFEYVEAGPDRVVVAWTVTPDHHQLHGIVHGGVYCSAVELTSSIGAALWFGDRGTVVGVSNHTNFLRSASEGRMTAIATPVHRGSSTQLWRAEIRDEQQRLVASGEVHLQNLTPRPPRQ
jgi:1,4-dihydroxy-2-naphthoyl-CoA hydrolase